MNDDGNYHFSVSPRAIRITLSLVWCVLAGVFFSTIAVHPPADPSFWVGLLQGLIALPAFVLSWILHDITVYQSAQDFLYNLGFFGGVALYLVLVPHMSWRRD